MKTLHSSHRRNSIMLALALFGALIVSDRVAQAASAERADILITGGTVITMDPDRRVMDDGAIAIVGSRIAAVGTTAELRARFRAREHEHLN